MSEAPIISNYDDYNSRMERSMMDKLFFLDKIEPDCIVDFGCANGALLQSIGRVNKNIKLIGYDNDPTMTSTVTNFPIYSDWNNIASVVADATHPAIVLSSVIHEVCHYGSKSDIDTFWSRVFDYGFEFIVIRDMIPGRAIDRSSCINDVRKIYSKFLGTKTLDDFERTWGSIESNKQLVHFLLLNGFRVFDPAYNVFL